MLAGSGGADSCSLVSVARYGSAISGGSAASKIDSAWPNFIAPPLSSPRTRKTWSAVRCWISWPTISAEMPPIRLPNPSAVRPKYPSGSPASLAVRCTLPRGTSPFLGTSPASTLSAMLMTLAPLRMTCLRSAFISQLCTIYHTSQLRAASR